MGFSIQGGITGTPADVDASNQLKIALPAVAANAGFSVMALETDPGTIVGRLVRTPETTQDYRIRVGQDTVMFSEQFTGAALNTGLWTSPTTTMTVTVASGFLNLNASALTTTATVARVQTYRSFPMFGMSPLNAKMLVQFSQTPQTGNVCEWGLGIATASSAPTDGAFFRLSASGNLNCIVSFNGVENTPANLNFASLIGTSTAREFQIVVTENKVEFYIDDVMVANVMRATAQGASVASTNLPILLRNYNSGTTSAGQVMKVGLVSVLLQDTVILETNNLICQAGGMGSQGQTGATMGSTANYANNANPTAAVPTNTTAALGTGLGGQFWETDTLAVNTDGIICSYQVPVGTAALSGKSQVIHGIKIDSYIQAALTGGGYNAQWVLCYGHTAVSLATAESATSKAPRRVVLGSNSVAAGAAALVQLTTIQISLTDPIVVNAGEFVAIVKKKVGTAPSAGTVAHLISFDSKWV